MKRTPSETREHGVRDKLRRRWVEGLKSLQAYRSDTVRGRACVLIGRREPATLAERLTWIRPVAADNNAGVREIAWRMGQGSE